MKKLLIGLASLMVACATVHAQGEVQFNNRIVGTVVVPVQVDGAGVSAGWTAQLYQQGAGGALTALTPTTTFRTGAGAGFVNPVNVTVPGVPSGGQATLVMRAFNGSTWESSLIQAQSNPISVTLGGGTLPPSALAGLTGFTVTVIPEPSTIALGVLGVGALLFMRRRK